MFRSLFALVLLCCGLPAQNRPLGQAEAMRHYDRILQLMQSASVAVPGLVRAAEPLVEHASQSLLTLQSGGNQTHAGVQYELLNAIRAFLALADSLPKPEPFPEEGRRQFVELRSALDRADAHFRALLESKEQGLRSSDRDNRRRYSEANGVVGPPANSNHRVVFFGDSITDGWRLNEYFPGKDYVNRGISGQITGQMLGRMLPDVIRLRPAAMVVLAGTNDLARHVPLDAIEDNLEMIAMLAQANQIKPIFASVLPVHDYNQDVDRAYIRSKARPPASIVELNRWLAAFCKRHGYGYIDYHSAMVDSAGFLQKELADDGLHPNTAGYRIMAPLVSAAIEAATAPVAKKTRK